MKGLKKHLANRKCSRKIHFYQNQNQSVSPMVETKRNNTKGHCHHKLVNLK
jgi:hypothetical protein